MGSQHCLDPKKDGKVRMCVDYRDLNRASLKDNFLLPHIDALVDNTAKNSDFRSWMVSPNTIKFRWLLKIGTRLLLLPCGAPFFYKVMPFWFEECWGNLSNSYGDVIPRLDAQRN